jgi:hypothetical protein
LNLKCSDVGFLLGCLSVSFSENYPLNELVGRSGKGKEEWRKDKEAVLS